MDELTALLEAIKDGGIVAVLVALGAAFYAGKIRLEREYQGIKADRDFWRDIAVKRISAELGE